MPNSRLRMNSQFRMNALTRQSRKYEGAWRFNKILGEYIRRKNYIAAHVVAFAQLEDKIREFHRVKRLVNGKSPKVSRGREDLSKMVLGLEESLTESVRAKAIQLIDDHHMLLQPARYDYDLGIFDAKHLDEVIAVTRGVQDAYRRFRRSHKLPGGTP